MATSGLRWIRGRPVLLYIYHYSTVMKHWCNRLKLIYYRDQTCVSCFIFLILSLPVLGIEGVHLPKLWVTLRIMCRYILFYKIPRLLCKYCIQICGIGFWIYNLRCLRNQCPRLAMSFCFVCEVSELNTFLVSLAIVSNILKKQQKPASFRLFDISKFKIENILSS